MSNNRSKSSTHSSLGKDAIEWLMKHGTFKSREEAVAIGQQWLQAGDFQHTEGNHSLEDGNFYYEFKVEIA
jgi:hypothetical protein